VDLGWCQESQSSTGVETCKGSKKGFYCCFGSERLKKESVGPLLGGAGNLVTAEPEKG